MDFCRLGLWFVALLDDAGRFLWGDAFNFGDANTLDGAVDPRDRGEILLRSLLGLESGVIDAVCMPV